MSDKDIIIRVSGTNENAEEFLAQLVNEIEPLGLIPCNQSIRAVPSKIRKIDTKNKKAKDVKLSVTGSESKIETFFKAVIDSITEETSLPSPSLNLKLEHTDSEVE